jgi:hypothetical protein
MVEVSDMCWTVSTETSVDVQVARAKDARLQRGPSPEPKAVLAIPATVQAGAPLPSQWPYRAEIGL